jgi:hypothetical protein
MERRRWKAFLRLNGETLVESDEDILNEFKGFIQALKRVGIDYSVVVNVERGETETLKSAEHRSSITRRPSPEKIAERARD